MCSYVLWRVRRGGYYPPVSLPCLKGGGKTAGIARTHLTMIENGDKQPNFETVWKIAVAFDMKPSEFIALVEKEITDKE